jgi:hypothetical protein
MIKSGGMFYLDGLALVMRCSNMIWLINMGCYQAEPPIISGPGKELMSCALPGWAGLRHTMLYLNC